MTGALAIAEVVCGIVSAVAGIILVAYRLRDR